MLPACRGADQKINNKCLMKGVNEEMKESSKCKEDKRMSKTVSLLLIMTLVSTAALSGVLAKYVITDNATDMARVARFGVVTTVEGDLFGDSYSAAGGNSIQAWNNANNPTATAGTKGQNIIAPGSGNDKGMTISVTGTPEVSTRIILDEPENASGADYVNTDVFLKKGNYSVMKKISADDIAISEADRSSYYELDNGTFTRLTADPAGDYVYKEIRLTEASEGADMLNNDYYPIQWSVGGTTLTGNNNKVAGVMSAVGSAMHMAEGTDIYAGKRIVMADPNTNLGGAIGSQNVSWKWAFGSEWEDAANSSNGNFENGTLVDREDTVLGELITKAAGTVGSYEVAVMDGATGTQINYASIPAKSGAANNVYVAYTGSTAPASWDKANVACLSVNFGARVTVEQVD